MKKYNCNICGKELAENELKNPTEIKACLGYGSDRHDTERHHIRWCADCFTKLLASCKHETQVSEFTEVNSDDYDSLDINPLTDKLPGIFCTVCGEGLVQIDLNHMFDLALKIESNNIKNEIRFCSKCFDNVIDSCKANSFLGHWD